MRFEILGPLQVVDEAGGLRLVAASRQRVLLAALLLHANQPVPVEELADAVWDGAPPAKAVATVRAYVMRLRHTLGPEVASRIITRDHGYLIRLDTSELDLLRFEALCRQAGAAIRARAWEEVPACVSRALELWRGMPLVDVYSQLLRDSRVPHLMQLRVQALEWRIEAELHRARHEYLIPQLQALVVEHPLRERFHAQLMLALARGGRRAEAMAAYQNARRVLVGELGIEPGPELRGLQERILAGDVEPVTPSADDVLDPASEGAVPRQLPVAVGHFVGRVRELKTLSELLDRTGQAGDMAVISAVSGAAGVGKTTLAVHWAHRHAGDFPDGQLYVNLRGFDPGGRPVAPTEALHAFLDALGVPAQRIPPGLDAQAALYRSLLAGKRILIVLDNAHDPEQARPLLPGSPTARAVVTSRNQLTSLVAIDGAHPLILDLLSPDEARTLLARRLGPERTAAEPRSVEEIIAACARLPLALAVAAARAATRPHAALRELAGELRDSQHRLDTLTGDDPSSEVRAVFSWSYQALSPGAARLFRLLGLHPGPDISAPVAASLAGLPPPQVPPLLAELSHASLLTEHTPGRYTYHDLLRAYATDLTHTVDSTDERRAATGRLLDHYLHTAHAAARLLFPNRDPITLTLAPPAPDTSPERLVGHREGVAWLTAEHPVLLAAVHHHASTGFDTHIWQLAWAVDTFLGRRGQWNDLTTVWQAALPAADRLGDPAAQAYAHRRLAVAHTELGRYPDAQTCFQRALDLCVRSDDRVGQANIHGHLAYLWQRQDRLPEALANAQQALTLHRAAGHHRGQAAALNAVGWYHTLLGDHTSALTHCEQALALQQQLGDPHEEANTWDSLGYTHHHLNHHAQAIHCYEHAIDLFQDIGDPYSEATTLTRLGDTQHTAGNPVAAGTAWQHALDILTNLDHPDADDLRAKLHDVNQPADAG
jgi:DNA-binding SARP family transcriptional activator